jgi:glycosyltransferase 2 family protein
MSDEDPRPASVRRRYAISTIKLTVSVALLVFLFSRLDTSRLWEGARRASLPWLIVALAIYALNVAASTWRWHVLLRAQDVRLRRRTLFKSFLVANFFNNFLPSNIGGDVIRIRDTAVVARSKTLATTVILVDRGLGLMGLVLVSALGATMVAGVQGHGASPIWPSWLWAGFLLGAAATAPVVWAPEGVGRLLQPLTIVHPEWVGSRIQTLTSTLGRFRDRPAALVSCFAGALLVQALLVLFYLSVVRALGLPVSPWDLAVIVPLSFVIQMLPVSVNGFGVREATFSFYFTRLGLPIESAVLLSLVATALTMLFSLTGAAVYVARRR